MLPEAFIQRMKIQLGDASVRFFEALKEPAPVSIRSNPFKEHHLFQSCEPVAWSATGRYLPERISFTLDPLFHAGCYYVQEASSMYIEQALNAIMEDGVAVKVLDLCAAPGGKSTHLLSLLPEGSLLVSNEVIPARNGILRENLSKWGNENAVVIQNDAKDIGQLANYFDVILVDAPCSGEGLFRKNPDATSEWSEDNLRMCSSRQKIILDDILPALKPNGLLIYSTCTYHPGENDEIISPLVASENFECLDLPVIGGVEPTNFGLQMFPHQIKGEGFYLSALRKRQSESPADIPTIKNSKARVVKFKNVQEWLEKPLAFELESVNDFVYALPKHHLNDIRLLQQLLYVRKAGICLGSFQGDALQPSHELALFTGKYKEIPRVMLDLESALRYLRGEVIPTPEQVSGWHLADYEGEALGWMKGAGKRYNNNYPKELRIRNL